MEFHIANLRRKANQSSSVNTFFLPVNPHGQRQRNVLLAIEQVPPLKQLPLTQSGILQLGPRRSISQIYE